MIDELSANLSRLQFALTAMYHYLFVPLTLGLSVIIAIMESVYVLTKKQIWLDMTKFWGKLFAINFAMGVATGLTMEFQFGTNWAYYSHYVGDIFGVPLAIEGLMAFFLESSFVGLFLFGWNKMGKRAHLTATWMMALGSNLSGLWILIANAWMQHPVGATFNPVTMRMELTSIKEVVLSSVAQAKFLHTISAGYVTGAVFVLSVSCYYLLRNINLAISKRSLVVASSFGLLSITSTIFLGDESGYIVAKTQRMKLAAMESMWQTEPAPAGFIVFGIPDAKLQATRFEIKVPYLLGLITTRSTNETLLGITDLVRENEQRIQNGIHQWKVLQRFRTGKSPHPDQDRHYLENNYHDIGYALLLKRYVSDVAMATKDDITKAANSTIPNVLPLFFSFRFMVFSGLVILLTFCYSFYLFVLRGNFLQRFFMRYCLLITPLPWLANELGWFVAEHGRQPWVIDGILPTFLGASTQSSSNVMISLSAFVLFYTALLIVDVFLMIRYIKLGPSYILSNKNHH
jgi:cytochrome bd ubiquinol oxidase subunit I